MNVRLDSIGCRLNYSEIETLARQFRARGYRVVGDGEMADLCVVNTCTVTHIADRKSRQAIAQLRRANPGAHLVVTGCYAQMAGSRIAGADLVVGNADKERLVDLVEEWLVATVSADGKQINGWIATEEERISGCEKEGLPTGYRTRAFVKIQDGCDNACTYCITRIARGRERSRRPEEVLTEIQSRLDEGYKEVVLTGVHIGGYGRDLGTNLLALLEAILARTSVPRLRLSSLEPWDFGPELLPLWSDSRFCRHLHLPLQSGSDSVLRRMGRRYTAAEFAAKVEMTRAAIPDLAVSTDVMVGFPGESEAEFEAGLRFVEAMGFSRLHVFRYSLRAGTLAALMGNPVSEPIKHARSQAMIAIGRESSRKFRQRFISRRLEVLWESRDDKPAPTLGRRALLGAGSSDSDGWSGYTDNYIRVTTGRSGDWHNVIALTELESLRGDGMWGRIIDDGGQG